MRERERGAAENICPGAALYYLISAQERQREARQHVRDLRAVLFCDRNRRADHKRSMQPKCRRAVGGRKLPVRKMALHDLIGWRYPFDAGQNLGCIVAEWHSAFQLEDDLRLDARLHK